MKLSCDSELWSRTKLFLKSEICLLIDSGFLFYVWLLGSLICRRISDLRTLPPHDFWIIILNCEIVSCVKTQKATLKCDKKDLGPDDDGFVSSAKQVSCQLVQENFSVTRWKERSSKENCYNELSTIPAGFSGLQASLSARPYHSTVVYRLGGVGEFWICCHRRCHQDLTFFCHTSGWLFEFFMHETIWRFKIMIQKLFCIYQLPIYRWM